MTEEDAVYGFSKGDSQELIRLLGGRHAPEVMRAKDLEQPPAYVIMTPSGGVPARSGSTFGTATATVYQVDYDGNATSTSMTVKVCNPSLTPWPGSCYAKIDRVQGGAIVLDPPAVTDIRVSSTTLQLRRNCDWSTWHTGEDCTA